LNFRFFGTVESSKGIDIDAGFFRNVEVQQKTHQIFNVSTTGAPIFHFTEVMLVFVRQKAHHQVGWFFLEILNIQISMPFSQAEVEYLFEKRQEMEQETFLKRRQDGD